MVFRVRAFLTEEDRKAWRRLAAQRERSARKKHRKAVRGWLGVKLCGIGNTVFGALMLCAVISGGMRAAWGILASVLTVTGPWIFLMAGGVLFGNCFPRQAGISRRLPCRMGQ